MTPQILQEIEQLLHQARKMLPEPPPLEDPQIGKIHQRLLSLEIDTHNLAVKRSRETQGANRR